MGSRWLEPEPFGASLGIYVPAVMAQRALNLVRTLALLWLMGETEYGLWALACMVFTVAGTLFSLGGFHGIVRLAGRYEQVGTLPVAFRRVSLGLLGLGILGAGVCILASGVLAEWTLGTVSADSGVSHARRVMVFSAALVNGLMVASYLNLTAWMRGLRLYRLVSATDIAYGLLFIATAMAAAVVWPSELAVLAAHAATLAVVLVAGTWCMALAVRRRGERAPSAAAAEGESSTGGPSFAVLLRFSVASMVGVLLWQLQGYASLWFVQRYHAEDIAGAYQGLATLCQVLYVLSAAMWQVVLSQTSASWEQGRPGEARRRLALAYKACMALLGVMAMGIVLTRDIWLLALPARFQSVRQVVPWLLMYVLSLAGLGHAFLASHLGMKPVVYSLLAAGGLILNAALARYGVPGGTAVDGAVAGAAAAGVTGLLALAAGFVVAWRMGFAPAGAVLAVAATPLALLLPAPWAGWTGLAWLVLLVGSGMLFSREERRSMRDTLARLRGSFGFRSR